MACKQPWGHAAAWAVIKEAAAEAAQLQDLSAVRVLGGLGVLGREGDLGLSSFFFLRI